MKKESRRNFLLLTTVLCGFMTQRVQAQATDFEGFKDAVSTGGEIVLGSDLTAESSIDITENGTSINGSNYVYDINDRIGFSITAKNVSLTNMKLTGGYHDIGGDNYGAAIINYEGGHITELGGEFYGNEARYTGTASGDSRGSVLYNGWYGGKAQVDKIDGYFHDNHSYADAQTTFAQALGTVIFNRSGTISEIIARAENNTAESISHGSINALSFGGFLDNFSGATIGKIDITSTGTIMKATSESGSADNYGGDIYNNGTINHKITISSNETSMIATSESGSAQSFGGNIFNRNTIVAPIDIISTGTQMTAISKTGNSYVYGGNIYNYGTINGNINIDSSETIMTATSTNGNAIIEGGDVYNSSGTITGDIDITSTNTTMTATSTNGNTYSLGGNIYNATAGKITKSIIISSIDTTMTATSTKGSAYSGGGNIYNYSTITGDVAVFSTGTTMTATSENGIAYAQGGQVYNSSGTITGNIDITSINTVMTATSTNGNAAINGSSLINFSTIIGDIDILAQNTQLSAVSETGNVEVWGGYIANGNTITGNVHIIGEGLQAELKTTSGKVGFYGALIDNDTIISGLLSGSMSASDIKLSAPEGSVEVQGGLIYNAGEMTLSGLQMNGNSLTIDAPTAKTTVEGSKIYNSGTLTIQADGETNDLYANNTIAYADGTRLREALYNAGGVVKFEALNGGIYNLTEEINGDGAGSLNFEGDGTGRFNLFADINGQDEVNFNGGYFVNMQDGMYHKINANKLNINEKIDLGVDVDLAGRTMDRLDHVFFGEKGLINVKEISMLYTEGYRPEDQVFVDFSDVKGSGKIGTDLKEAVYNATVTYDVIYHDEEGKFEFVQSGVTEKAQESSAAMNASQVMTAAINSKVLNRDVNSVKGLSAGEELEATPWVEMFGFDDKIELRHYGRVDAQFYGVVGGVDTKVHTYDNGMKGIYGVFGSAMGSRQRYHGNKIKQKAGYLGASADIEKDNIRNKTLINVGYVRNKSSSKYGEDHFDSYILGISNKLGYKYSFGAYEIIPSMKVLYMGVKTEDYKNSAGVKIENPFMNVFEFTPEIKVRRRFASGWEGDIRTAYKWYAYSNDKVRAGDILLPEISVKPYVEYGFGLKKNVSVNGVESQFYMDLNRHDGGREGWDGKIGFKYNF